MQPSIHLNQKDIVRLQKAIGKLLAIGEALLGKNGHGAAPPVKMRKKRARRSPSVPPSGSSSPE